MANELEGLPLAGRELDRLIAKRFKLPEYGTGQEFGTAGGLPVRYSRDVSAAMELLKLSEQWSVLCDSAYKEAYTVKVRVEGRPGENSAITLPLAICRAMLLACGTVVDGE